MTAAVLLAACGPGETGTPPSSTEARAVETPDPAQPELASAAAATLSVAASDPVAFAKPALSHGRNRGNPVRPEPKVIKMPAAEAPKHDSAAPEPSPAAPVRPTEVPAPQEDVTTPPPAMMSSPVDDADGDL